MERLVVLGGGESGVGTALLAKKEGYEVFVSDKGKIADKYKKVLINNEINWEEEKHTEELILNAGLVMKSPGIPEKVAIVQQLIAKGVKVISEIEFASEYTDSNIIGITGSNGKTTTATWTNFILKNGGLSVALAGNIGDSFAKAVLNKSAEHYVFEISSFQLDGVEDFRPHIAVLTNITPDHLDRYEYKYENYIASKFRITKNQRGERRRQRDGDDPTIVEWLSKNKIKAKKLPLTFQKEVEEGAFLDDNNNIIVRIEDKEFIMAKEEIALKGEHNTKNAMAASTVAQLLKIRKQTIRESLGSFQGVEHRLEKVLKINNVQYINDSKATNINATYYALDSVSAETIWIVGGVDKGNKYEELLSLVNEKVKAIICLGIDNARIKEVFGNCVEHLVETQSMKEAVDFANHLSEKGDTVLLSPACASFDLFQNYEDRGRQFKEYIRSL